MGVFSPFTKPCIDSFFKIGAGTDFWGVAGRKTSDLRINNKSEKKYRDARKEKQKVRVLHSSDFICTHSNAKSRKQRSSDRKASERDIRAATFVLLRLKSLPKNTCLARNEILLRLEKMRLKQIALPLKSRVLVVVAGSESVVVGKNTRRVHLFHQRGCDNFVLLREDEKQVSQTADRLVGILRTGRVVVPRARHEQGQERFRPEEDEIPTIIGSILRVTIEDRFEGIGKNCQHLPSHEE